MSNYQRGYEDGKLTLQVTYPTFAPPKNGYCEYLRGFVDAAYRRKVLGK